MIMMIYNKLFATFTDKQMELDFLEHERKSSLKYLRPVMLALGILFFMFVIPDYFLNPTAHIFWVILVIRSVFLLLVIVLYLMLSKKEVQANLHRWISVYTFAVTVFYLLIYSIYESSIGTIPFYIQSLAIIVFILIFFSLESYWLPTVAIAFCLSAGFMIISHYRWDEIPSSGFAAVSVYMILALLISAGKAYRLNIYKRIEFLNKLQFKELSEKDPLTGICNRFKFDAELNWWLDQAKRYHNKFALIMLDIDNMKTINDLHGHITGDEVLSEFADLVNQELRSSDIFARWGGDEFIILLPYAVLSEAAQMAERICAKVFSHSFNQVESVSFSFGAAEYEEGDNHISIVQRVDSKLYEAKMEG
jgi:two-component system, cell cycle response regulator